MNHLMKSVLLMFVLFLAGTIRTQEAQKIKSDKSKRSIFTEISAKDLPVAVQTAILSDRFKGQEVVKVMRAKGENREFYIVKFKDGEKTTVHRFALDGSEKQKMGHKKHRGRKV